MKTTTPLSALRLTMLGSSLRDLRARNSTLLRIFLGGFSFLRTIAQSYLIVSLTLSSRSLIPYSMLQMMSLVGILFKARKKLRLLLRRLKTEESNFLLERLITFLKPSFIIIIIVIVIIIINIVIIIVIEVVIVIIIILIIIIVIILIISIIIIEVVVVIIIIIRVVIIINIIIIIIINKPKK